VVLLGIVALSSFVLGDVYLHNPRGSNNRLNGNGQNVQNNQRLCDTQNNDKGGYCWGPPLYYYVGSHLMIEWTNQHACNNPKVHCNIIIQYMCGEEVRDGVTTERIPDNEDDYNTKVSPNPLTGEDEEVFLYGMHEDYQYYQDCKSRHRNKGLFTADQNMNNRNSARHTRQDNNGNQNGFECPEERDYYPYWHPTPWKDIAILVDDKDNCDYFQSESQNVKDKNYCSIPEHNNQYVCLENGGTWIKRTSWGIDPPACEEAQWTRTNHLGNSALHNNHEGYASSYNWTIPDDIHENCVLRLRYNISTGDYEGWGFGGENFVNASFNGADNSPVQQDEVVEYFGNTYEMALNTDQYGRTFQDRSHVFEIRERPDDIDDDARIWNLNVRGKRGNIVQVYPAVEYDFVPNRLHTKVGDYVHFQWTGCDTNPANNDGEGTQQTDRSNIAQMESQRHNKPWNNPDDPMFDDPILQARMAFIDQVGCTDTDDDQDVTNCEKLNAAPTPYFDGGVYRVNKTGEWHYMGTRNNNFSNRSQKGYMTAEDSFPSWAIALIVIGVVGIAIAAVIGAVALYAKSHPKKFEVI
jgi:hypothetical protein